MAMMTFLLEDREGLDVQKYIQNKKNLLLGHY